MGSVGAQQSYVELSPDVHQRARCALGDMTIQAFVKHPITDAVVNTLFPEAH